MTPRDRLRRVVIVIITFARNLAYYRVGWKHPQGWKDPPLKPTASFWRTVNSNCIDICVLEWCKLFGDGRGARRPDEHSWVRVVARSDYFERELLQALNMSSAQFDAYRDGMRAYRDKFLAHLDSELTMNIPNLDAAEAAVKFYHSYLIGHEARQGDLSGLVDTPEKLILGYKECETEAAKVYAAL